MSGNRLSPGWKSVDTLSVPQPSNADPAGLRDPATLDTGEYTLLEIFPKDNVHFAVALAGAFPQSYYEHVDGTAPGGLEGLKTHEASALPKEFLEGPGIQFGIPRPMLEVAFQRTWNIVGFSIQRSHNQLIQYLEVVYYKKPSVKLTITKIAFVRDVFGMGVYELAYENRDPQTGKVIPDPPELGHLYIYIIYAPRQEANPGYGTPNKPQGQIADMEQVFNGGKTLATGTAIGAILMNWRDGTDVWFPFLSLLTADKQQNRQTIDLVEFADIGAYYDAQQALSRDEKMQKMEEQGVKEVEPKQGETRKPTVIKPTPAKKGERCLLEEDGKCVVTQDRETGEIKKKEKSWFNLEEEGPVKQIVVVIILSVVTLLGNYMMSRMDQGQFSARPSPSGQLLYR